MTSTDIRVGQTHTSRMLTGSCTICGLQHPRLATTDACVAFRAAVGPGAELVAWRGLKAAVETIAESRQIPPLSRVNRTARRIF